MSDEREELAKIIDPNAWSGEWISTRRRDEYRANALDLAEQILAAGYRRQPVIEPVTPDFEKMFRNQVEYSIRLQRRLESVGIEPWGDMKESAEWASRHLVPETVTEREYRVANVVAGEGGDQ